MSADDAPVSTIRNLGPGGELGQFLDIHLPEG